MVKFDAMDAFGVHTAHDCESIESALREIEEARKYGIDYASELVRVKKILLERKAELGCT